MPNYLTPGVYMEEVDRGSKPIEAVGTAVAAFVGYTAKASDVKNGQSISLIGKPTLVTNWSQYVAKFGAFVDGAYTPDSVYGYFANGGTVAYIVSVRAIQEGTAAVASIQTSDKSGDLLKIVAKSDVTGKLVAEVKGAPSLTAGKGKPAAKEAEGAGAGADSAGPASFTLSIKLDGKAVESYDGLTMAKGDRNVATVLQQSKLVEVQVVADVKDDSILPADGSYNLATPKSDTKAITLNDYQGDIAKRTGIAGLEPIEDVTMILTPDLMSAYQAGDIDMKGVQAVQQAVIDYCELVRYCFAILDTPPGLMPQEAKEWRMQVNYDTTRAALYYPWIEVADMSNPGRTRFVPPSGHMAGVYARVDNERGVHKAPANEIVRTTLGLEVQVTKGEQSLLNPIGVNCIRSFPGRGIRIWGARTLSSDASWRYIPVRRLFNMIEESIERGTQWVVFEPNDSRLWGRVKRDVSSFLKMVWGSGALFGATADQAFFVKCDDETNPVELRDLGQMVVEVGIAPVKPAEFVIFRIGQWSGE